MRGENERQGKKVNGNTCDISSVKCVTKGLFTWSGGPRSSGVGFFCFHALGDTKQKKPTPLDRGPCKQGLRSFWQFSSPCFRAKQRQRNV